MRFLWLLLATCLVAPPARAAGFDCTRATSPREKLICANPRLSAADSQLATLYTGALASLSPAGAKRLPNSERAWFRFTDELCGFRAKGRPVANNGQAPGFCLRQAYDERVHDMRQAGRHGPYVFTRVDTYDVEPDRSVSRHCNDEDAPCFDNHHTGYPQIDAATDPVLVAWNAKAAADGASNGDVTFQGERDNESDGDYELGLVTRSLISTRWTARYDTGGAHGLYGAHAWNALLTAPLGEMKPRDLFGGWDDTWKNGLEPIALAAIRRNGWSGADDTLRVVIDNPSSWFLRPEGLDISFSAYDGGCYMCTPENGLVPWTDLAPILRTKLVP